MRPPSLTRSARSALATHGVVALPVGIPWRTIAVQIGLLVRVTLEDDRLVWTARINNREKDKGVEVTERYN